MPSLASRFKFRASFNKSTGVIVLVLALLLTAFAIPVAQAQTLTVLHTFTGGSDGGSPEAGITFDQQGRIYGTASDHGSYSRGVVYRLVREGEGWIFSPIYSFGPRDSDGSGPYARVIFGPDGLLYGTTFYGGTSGSGAGYGTVFSLRPPAIACMAALCPWVETILYSFKGTDGAYPFLGDVSFDRAGNIYGTTFNGGTSGHGVVYKLTRCGSGWVES